MHKVLVTGLTIAALLTGSIASAQTYYSGYTAGYTGACLSLSRDLTVGSRGADVSSLQSFLVAQNYPGSGSWMVTGYYGQATAAAVRNFQIQRSLPQTGMVDSVTRSMFSSCGGYGSTYQNPFSYTYPTNTNTYPYGYPYSNPLNQYGSVRIDSLSVTSAVTGAAVTISGSGFDYANNTVYVGSTPVANIASYNGNSLSFTVPQNVSGQVLIYVANTRGTSNSLPLTVINYGGCTYGCQQTPVTISSLSPDNGAVGSSVTIYGSGFSTTGNSVRFGNGLIINRMSSDGRSLSFTVPSNLSGYNNQTTTLGSYYVSVTNAAGYTSNALPFTVTSLGTSGTPTITSVTGPTTLNTGVTGTWSLTLNAPSNTYTSLSVRWGDENTFGAMQTSPQSTSLSGQQTFTFTHSYAQAGTYTVTFTATNSFGQSNTSTVTVQVSGQGTGSVSLNSLSPVSGRAGTQVALQGTGFTTYENTVHFGIGGTQHLPSYNGSTIYFTIPSYISPCDVVTNGSYCATYAQQVTPGQYQVYVTNAYGQTSQQTFTVTQ